jgi:hypothetical protein
MANPTPADRFRLGDIWRSPRGKDWQVDKVVGPHVRLLRIVGNQRTTQWRGVWDTGRDMTDAWERLQSGAELQGTVQTVQEVPHG